MRMKYSFFAPRSKGDGTQPRMRTIKMRLSWIGMSLLLLLIIVTFLFSKMLTRQEEESKIQNLRSNGIHLVNLIALFPIKDFETAKRDFLLRTLSEYTSQEGLIYLFIHDNTGKPIISFAPGNTSSQIPEHVKMQSLFTMGLAEQSFKTAVSGEIVYEFAKPIFERGEKAGTVRLGLRFRPVAILSLQHISILAMIIFSLFAVLILGYYGIVMSLKRLRTLHENFKRNDMDLPTDMTSDISARHVMPMIDDLEQSLSQIQDKLNQIKTINSELTSKLGVTTFEKNQIMKILDSINFGIIITDMHNNVGHINGYMLKLLNKKREEIIDRPLEETLNHDDILSFISTQEILDQDGPANHKEITFPDLAPGETFQVSSSYMQVSERNPIGKMIFVKNITHEKLAEESRHGFIAHIAHELLTPLTNIKSYSEMLIDGEIQDPDVQKEFYNTINEETNRLSLLVQNLLNISKIEMGSLTINRGLVRTDWFVDGCLAPIEASALDKNITIEKKLPETFPMLMADKELLKAAIINILGNALKYTPESGKITFSITEQDGYIVFEVIDTGYGIATEDIPHIFDKFYRSDNPLVTKQTGSGLGLSITSDIVYLHNGEIGVESELGKGSHFTIRIPKEEYQIGKE